MDNSAIVHSRGGSITLTGDAIQLYAAAQLRGSITLYIKCGLIPTRGVTIRRMLDITKKYTGKDYKNSRGEQQRAVEDLTVWINTMKAAMPTIQE